eukprot:762478-Hanusia_phi.AAC.7
MKVVIVGGGVAGLTLAYHLCCNNEYEVELYERHDKLGGYARTDGNSEHSPRVILPGYFYFKEICNSIPEIKQNMKVAHSHDIGFNVNVWSAIKVVASFVPYILTPSSDDRVSLRAILPNDIDKETYRYIVSICSKIGEHPDAMPVSKVIHLAYTLMQPFDNYYTFKQSTGKGFFDPLERHLIKKGVKIYKNHTLNSLIYQYDKVDSVIINYKIVIGDVYVLALDVTGLNKVHPTIDTSMLERKTRDLQMGFQIEFNRLGNGMDQDGTHMNHISARE